MCYKLQSIILMTVVVCFNVIYGDQGEEQVSRNTLRGVYKDI